MDRSVEEARRLLHAHRSLADKKTSPGRVHFPFSSRDSAGYSYQEVNAVLAGVLDSDGPVEVVRALLGFGADVNFSKRRSSGALSKFSLRDGRSHRSDLLLRATIRCRAETVRLLATQADQENLDSVLHQAILRADLAVLQALLDHGANPVNLHEDFQNAIHRNQVGLVHALLSGHRLPCLTCRSAGLRLAVTNRSLEITTLLLQRWADVNYDNAAALVKAVELLQPDMVTALLSGPVRPSPRSLDAAVGKAHQLIRGKGASAAAVAREVIEMCLSLGAAGTSTTTLLSEGVVEAVNRNNIDLLNTILHLRQLPEDYEILALQEAIRGERLDVLIKLLEFNPSKVSLTTAVLQAMEIFDSKLRYEVILILLKAGARNECTAEALIRAVQNIITPLSEKRTRDRDLDRRLFSLLLDEGKADVNHRQGEALRLAVQAVRSDLVEEIVMRRPSAEALGAALPWAMSITDGEQKQTLVGMLLVNAVCQDAAGRALVEAFRDGPDNLDFIELLLTRSSVNYNNGEVFIYAVRNFQPKAFTLLLGQGVSYKALFTVVMEALRAPNETRLSIFTKLLGRLGLDHLNASLKHAVLQTDKDLGLVEMLLEAGAEAGHQDGVCIKHAACNLDLELMRLLSQHCGQSAAIFTQALSAAMSRGRQWIAFEHIEMIQLLIRHGASGQAIHKAMVEVADHVAGDESLKNLGNTLLNLFITANGDVNYENGKAVGIAAGRGDPSLFAFLLKHGATPSTACMAISVAIMAHHDEKILLQLVKVFSTMQLSRKEISRNLPGTMSPILLCLKSYPDSVALIEALAGAGCDIKATIPFQIYSDSAAPTHDGKQFTQEPEPISILMSTLLQDYRATRPTVFRALVRLGADISYTTPKTRTTALMLAAMAGRRGIARILLESGANPSSRDIFGRSALFFASKSGDADLVSLLLKSRPLPNDGSLHEASRLYHAAVIQLLLSAGHDPNHRSPYHSGRTPLGELARSGAIPATSDTARITATLDLLTYSGASPLLKTPDTASGKTTIFLALDNNPHAQAMTQLLLQHPSVRRTIHSEENTFYDGRYYYSATMYVAKGLAGMPKSQVSGVLQLLRRGGPGGVGIIDRFYAQGQAPGEIAWEFQHSQSYSHSHSNGDAAVLSEDMSVSRTRGAGSISAVGMGLGPRSVDGRSSEFGDDATVVGSNNGSVRRRDSDRTLVSNRAGNLSRTQSRSKREEQKHKLLYEEDWMLAEKEMLERYHYREKDTSREKQPGMTALKTQRGNIIGQVDLEELRRWQQRDDYLRHRRVMT